MGRIERGGTAKLPLGVVRSVADALDARIDTYVRWQGGDLSRLVNAGHAAMHELVAAIFTRLDGWTAEPEVSFSVFGERGVIDLAAWHPATRSLLVIELKTELVDISELMGTLDRKRRLSVEVARDRHWSPAATSVWVVVADSRTNRRTLSGHAHVLRSKLPADGRAVHAWLRRPAGSISALSFLPDVHKDSTRRTLAPVRRVTPRSAARRRA